MKLRVATLVLLAALSYSAAYAQDMKGSADQPMAVSAKSLVFNDIAVPGFPAGMKIAVLSGDPGKEGAYTLRLQFPDGYAFPPHWHPTLEYLTVISGTFFLGNGDKVDKSAAKPYTPGDYLVAPSHMSHFGWVKGQTVVQLHGTGPFQIKLAGEQ